MQNLIEQLNHTDAAVRYSAAQQLGAMNDERAVDALATVLADENHKVQYAAFSGLVKIGNRRPLPQAVDALLNKPTSRMWKLLALDIGMRLRSGLLEMAEADDRIADPLVSAFEDEAYDESQRALIVRLLGRTGDTTHIDAFIRLLFKGSPLMQAAAAEALGYIGDERAISPLIVTLKGADSALREISINALARLGGDEAIAHIEPLLQHYDEWTRRAAATAMATLGHKDAASTLMKMLTDDSEVVRDAADAALQTLIVGE